MSSNDHGFPSYRQSKKLRLLPLKIFPYVITYHFTGKEIIVARIVHGRRHPRQRSSSEG